MNLSRLSLGYKVAVTLFMISVLVGLLFSHVHMRYLMQAKDGEPGVSVTDVRYFFAGDPSKSVLQVMIDGPVHSNLANIDEREAVESWIAAGATAEAYETSIAGIFANRCVSCHGPEGERAQSPLTSYPEVYRYTTVADTGVGETALARMSVQTLLVTICLFALVGAMFAFTRFREGWKGALTLLPFAALLINVLSWWSAKQSAGFIHVIVFSAIVAVASIVIMCLLAFLDLWILPEYED